MKRTRLFDGKLRLIDEQLYTIVEASRIVARYLTFSLSRSLTHSLSLSLSPTFSPVRDSGMEKPPGYKLT